MSSGGVPTEPIDSGPGTCVPLVFAQPPTPIDVLLLVDRSSSMGDPIEGTPPTSRLSAVQAAVTAFVRRAEASAAGAAVGIEYFPRGGIAPESCQADYTSPDVEIGLLPGNADAIAASIAKQTPSGFAPTAVALSGSIAHMKKWATAHPGRVPAIVLVTDGLPTECDPQDIAGVARIAMQGFDSEPRVRTFVVALGLGPGGSTLGQLPNAAGGGDPVLIDGGDVVNRFLAAMLQIMPTPLACSIDLATVAGTTSIDPAKVNLEARSNATLMREAIPAVGTDANCASNSYNGWYYPSVTSRKVLALCDALCRNLPDVRVDVLVGCGLPIIPPP